MTGVGRAVPRRAGPAPAFPRPLVASHHGRLSLGQARGRMTVQLAVPEAMLAEVRSVCLALPEVYEEEAWVGTRWRVRGKTFAHVLGVDGGWPPAYARASGHDGPVFLLTFRAAGMELEVLRRSGPPFFAPPWRGDEVGLVIDDGTDWAEIAELVTDSYCVLAPRKLADQVSRPAERE